MTATKINLAQLRDRARMNLEHKSWGTSNAGEYEQEIYELAEALIPLIDTAEAANDVDLEYHALAAEGEGLHTEAQRIRRLSRSLDRYEQ